MKRLLFWVLQASVVTWAAWGLLRWNYEAALEDLVPLRIPTLQHVSSLMLTMTWLTGGMAAAISLIFMARVERETLNNAAGVSVCTGAALWAYVFFARVGGGEFEVNRVFLAGSNYQVYAVGVALGVALLNGLLSLVAGALNPTVRS